MPSSSTAPSVGSYRPIIRRWMVDLPEPTRPISATRSPGAMRKLTPSSAVSSRVRVAEAARCGTRSRRAARGAARRLAAFFGEGRSTGLAIRRSSDCDRRARALVLHQQADDLAGRRQRAAGQHRGGDQRAHRQLALADQVHADHDHRHGHDLRQRIGAYMAPRRQARMRTLVRARKVLTRSQRAWITPSAPCVLIVSMPVRLSTSVALRCALAR